MRAGAEPSKHFPDYYYPYECDILATNQKHCLDLWTKISLSFRAKKLFPERSGTPDLHGKQAVIEELKKAQKLKYIRTCMIHDVSDTIEFSF